VVPSVPDIYFLRDTLALLGSKITAGLRFELEFITLVEGLISETSKKCDMGILMLVAEVLSKIPELHIPL
jgi:hypothetical protein